MCDTVMSKCPKDGFKSSSVKRSVSLLDLSVIEKDLKLKTVSNDTIGSHTSFFKDSGFNQTGSSSSLGSVKEKENEKRINELEEELRYKQVLIGELQESNQNLRLKYAEAENKITTLRLQCESHCKCCKTHPPEDSSHFNSDFDAFERFDKKITPKNTIVGVTNLNESYLKVKQWQEELVSGNKSDFLSPRNSKTATPKSKLSLVSSHGGASISKIQTQFQPLVVSTPITTPVKSPRRIDESVSDKLRYLHKESQLRYSSSSCPNSSSDSEEAILPSTSKDRRSEEILKSRLEDRFEESASFPESKWIQRPSTKYACRNHIPELEMKVQRNMNKIAKHPLPNDFFADNNKPLDCWKEVLRPKSAHEMGPKTSQLLEKIKEARTIVAVATQRTHSIWKRNKKCLNH